MIYRPLYVEKIMAYVDTPFVKILREYVVAESQRS